LYAQADAVASPAVAPSEKERLLHERSPPTITPRRAFVRGLLGWKKHRISPLLGTALNSEEISWKELLQTLEIKSLWTGLPDHLLEAILSLVKDGKDDNDWSIVQVSSLFFAAP
jgi:hypothetical protein